MLPNLLLLALPASGKSEIRRYLDSLDPEVRSAEMGLGSLVHLDDYPYVLFMRRVSQKLRRLGLDPVFFASDEAPLADPRLWGTLMSLAAVLIIGGGLWGGRIWRWLSRLI